MKQQSARAEGGDLDPSDRQGLQTPSLQTQGLQTQVHRMRGDILDAIESRPSRGDHPATPIGIPALAKLAFDGIDLAPVWNCLVDHVNQFPADAAAFMDLSTIAHIQGRPQDRLMLQARALDLQRVYRQPPAPAATQPLRLLAFMAPGDFMANLPIEFLLEGSGVMLDMVYVVPGLPLWQPLPAHDVAMVAVAESDENQAVLAQIAALLPSWNRPVLNAPDRIARLTRDGTWELLRSAPGVAIPQSLRIDRPNLVRIARGEASIVDALQDSDFPIIARPVDSHAGEGLARLENAAAIDDYLRVRPEHAFYIAPFVDYRGKDGLYRKYRIALIEGCPYACHMATSEHWMIHYLNADMRNNAGRRAEEARFMADFEGDFAVRHATALSAIAERVGLEYIPFDCGETPDGKLLVFETGTNMIVHAMDPPDLFPYKPPQMQKVFGAFQSMLRNACER
jgi:glutathione synthase/RimK-type ligase-like ATP-grasp enzyme